MIEPGTNLRVYYEHEVLFRVVKPITEKQLEDLDDLLYDSCPPDLSDIRSYIREEFPNGEIIPLIGSGGYSGPRIEVLNDRCG